MTENAKTIAATQDEIYGKPANIRLANKVNEI